MKYQQSNKKANLIIFSTITFLAIIFVALIWISASGPNASSGKQISNSKLTSDQTLFDFGKISMVRGKVKTSFKIKNMTSDAIKVAKIYTSCMCTEASLIYNGKTEGPFGMITMGFVPTINEDIAPGGEATVEAEFNPAAHGPSGVGSVVRQVYVDTADGGKLTLEFKAQVTP